MAVLQPGQASRRTGPERPLGIAAQGPDFIGRQPFGRGERGVDPAVGQPVQAGVGADPNRVVVALGQGEDHVAGQAVAGGQAAEPATVEAGQSGAQRADPGAAQGVLQDRTGVIAGQPLAGRIERRTTVEELIQAVLGANPQAALAVLAQTVDRALRQPVAGAEAFDLAAGQPTEAIPGADPDHIAAAAGQAEHVVVGQSVGGGESLFHPLGDADQSVARADPDGSAARVEQNLHGCLEGERLDAPPVEFPVACKARVDCPRPPPKSPLPGRCTRPASFSGPRCGTVGIAPPWDRCARPGSIAAQMRSSASAPGGGRRGTSTSRPGLGRRARPGRRAGGSDLPRRSQSTSCQGRLRADRRPRRRPIARRLPGPLRPAKSGCRRSGTSPFRSRARDTRHGFERSHESARRAGLVAFARCGLQALRERPVGCDCPCGSLRQRQAKQDRPGEWPCSGAGDCPARRGGGKRDDRAARKRQSRCGRGWPSNAPSRDHSDACRRGVAAPQIGGQGVEDDRRLLPPLSTISALPSAGSRLRKPAMGAYAEWHRRRAAAGGWPLPPEHAIIAKSLLGGLCGCRSLE